jgi:opacity protein-like surface antigen
MKKLLLTTATLFALAGPALAADLSFGAYGEYALEEESISLGVSANYVLGATTLGAELNAIKYNGDELDLDSLDLSVTYAISGTADLYGVVTLDSDLDYDEAVIGIAVTF